MGLLCDVIFAKHQLVPQPCLQESWPVDREYVRFQRKSWHIQGYLALQLWTTHEKRVTDSFNCEELAAANANMHLEQPPVPHVFVCVGISLIDKSTHWEYLLH